jgi:putative aldouronate transport system permease protein
VVRGAMRRSGGELAFQVIDSLAMILLMLVCLYPFLYVAFASVSLPVRIVVHRGLLLAPLGFSLSAYEAVFANPNIISGYVNTLIVLFAGTSLNLLLTSLAAYGLSRKQFGARSVLMFAIVFTMLFNGGLIPLYLQVNKLHLLDTRWALILPSAMSAWNLVIMRTYLQGLPDSLEESARIDGANDWRILFQIILPLSMPVVAVMVLFYGVQHWNSWFHAMIFLRNRGLYPLQIILREILIANDTMRMTSAAAASVDMEQIGETIKYATIIVATVPILAIYPALQKYFMKGVMIGAIKG